MPWSTVGTHSQTTRSARQSQIYAIMPGYLLIPPTCHRNFRAVSMLLALLKELIFHFWDCFWHLKGIPQSSVIVSLTLKKGIPQSSVIVSLLVTSAIMHWWLMVRALWLSERVYVYVRSWHAFWSAKSTVLCNTEEVWCLCGIRPLDQSCTPQPPCVCGPSNVTLFVV